MKKYLSLVSILLVVFGLSVGTISAWATNNADVNLAGNWYLIAFNSDVNYLSFLSTDINGNPTYALEQKGDKITMTGKGRYGDLQASGIIKGNEFEMTGVMGNSNIRLKGTYEDGRIMGKVSDPFKAVSFIMKRK